MGSDVLYATLPSGEISNQLRIKIHNQSDELRSYTLRLVTPAGAELVVPENPIQIKPRELRESNVFVVLPASSFAETGEVPCTLEISDGVDFTQTVSVTLLGPK